MGEVTNDQDIQGIYQQLRAILTRSRSRAWQAVNSEMFACYWEIGRLIVEEEQRGKARAGYGKYLIKELAERLTKEFGKGFTLSNIKYFRQFYLSFSIGHAVRGQLPDGGQIDNVLNHKSLSHEKGHSVRDELPVIRAELSWTHYRLLLKVERPDVRKFYMEECIAGTWGTRQLERQINSFYYERLLASRDRKLVRNEIHDLEQNSTPEDIINYYTREMMTEGDSPPLGIILCSDKSDAVVRYTLPEGNKQIFASRYKLYLPSEEELAAELTKERRMLEMKARLSEKEIQE